MFKKHSIEDFLRLASFMELDIDNRLSTFRIDQNRLFLEGYSVDETKHVELMLRLGWKGTITVSRIEVATKRNGHGTYLMELIKGIALDHGYDTVNVECPNEDCQAFISTLGFTPVQFSGNTIWTLPLAQP